jgi:hypothetical protein
VFIEGETMSTESPVTAQRPEDLDDRVAALAVLATNIVSDAERLRDLVAELAADGAKVPDGIDELVDRLVAAAGEAARDFDQIADADDWTEDQPDDDQ